MKKNTKGAIELSANFIVIILISIVVLVGGLALFFKMSSNLKGTVETLDSQTEDNIKSVMLSNNYRVAVYPTDLTIGVGDSQMVGLGIVNIFDQPDSRDFTISVVPTCYDKSGISYSCPIDEVFYTLTSPGVSTKPKEQIVKGILLTVPKTGINKGQIVYTISVATDDGSGNKVSFGKTQAYITVP